MRVLIIEDEALTALYLAALLEEMGCGEFAVAHSEAEAYRLAEDLHPTLIVADVNLGRGGSGLRAARSLAQHEEIPVIFVTGNRDQVEADLFEEVVALIDKPLNPTALRAAVAEHL
jgi:CheY-like chemotaxis protein